MRTTLGSIWEQTHVEAPHWEEKHKNRACIRSWDNQTTQCLGSKICSYLNKHYKQIYKGKTPGKGRIEGKKRKDQSPNTRKHTKSTKPTIGGGSPKRRNQVTKDLNPLELIVEEYLWHWSTMGRIHITVKCTWLSFCIGSTEPNPDTIGSYKSWKKEQTIAIRPCSSV